MKYLVNALAGPTFHSPQEARTVLEDLILPTFDILEKLESEGVILGGGLPVGDRALVFIIESASNDDLDHFLRSLPAWGALTWKVTALQGFEGRASVERKIDEQLKNSA